MSQQCLAGKCYITSITIFLFAITLLAFLFPMDYHLTIVQTLVVASWQLLN